ncbi:hypothetical protein ACO0SA_001986 [Hanseniaspora valbyensis]
MDPPSNSGILTRASRRNRRSTITGLANTPLGKSRRETLISEKIITNSGGNNVISDLGSASRIAPSVTNNNSNINRLNNENEYPDTNNNNNNINNVELEQDGKENLGTNNSPAKNASTNYKLEDIQSSNENTGTNYNKRSLHDEFQLDNIVSNTKRRKINGSNISGDIQDGNKSKSKRYLNNQMNHNNFNDLPMLGDLEDDDDDDEDDNDNYIQNNNGVTNSNFHSAIKNRVLDRFMDNNNSNNNNASSPSGNSDSIGDGTYPNVKDSSKLRNRDLEVAELKRSNELLTIKIATYLEDFKKIDTNGAMEEQFNKLVKWKHNYQKVSQELDQWKTKCEEVERNLKDVNDNPSLANKDKFIKLESEINVLKEENKKLQDSVLDVSKERNEFKDECDAIKYQKDTLEREKNSIALSLTTAESKMKILDSDLQARNTKVAELNGEIDLLKKELDLFKKKYEDSLENLNSLKNNSIEKVKFEADLKLKDEEISKLETKLASLNNKLKLLEESNSVDKEYFNNSITKLNKNIDEYKNLLDEKTLELKKLNTKFTEIEVESEFKINKLTRELESEKMRNSEDKEYVSKMNGQIRSLQNELLVLQDIQVEKEKLGLKCVELEKLAKSKTDDLEKLENDKIRLLNNISEMKEKIEDQKEEILRLQKKQVEAIPRFQAVNPANSIEVKELKADNEQLQSKIALLNSKLKTQNNQYLEEIDVLQKKLANSNAKLNENMKDYINLEDELSAVNEEKDRLKLKLQKIDQETAQKMDELIEENNVLKLDLNKFSKTALKYQNENTFLKDDLIALEARLKTYNKTKNTMERDIEMLKMQKDQEIKGIKKQYIQELRNLQEENLQLTENLTMFKNSISSKSRVYSGNSNNNERDSLINNLQDQLKFFKNKYDQEVSKNRDLQTMNEHYRKLVNQSTNDLRMGRMQSKNVSGKRVMEDDRFRFFDDRANVGSSNDRYRYTSSDFNI